MNFLDIFKKNDVSNLTGILSEPGDKLEARVTDSNRKVVKIQKDKGQKDKGQKGSGTVNKLLTEGIMCWQTLS